APSEAHEAEEQARAEAREDHRTPGHEVLDRLDVAVGAREDPALARAVEVAHRQALEVVEDVAPKSVEHRDPDAVGRAQLDDGDRGPEEDVGGEEADVAERADDVAPGERAVDRLLEQ